MEVTPELLRSFPLFKQLPTTSLAALAEQCRMERLARRAVVLNAGEQENKICFLFEGRLQGVDFTVDGREVGLYFVEPGDYCGELSLFDYGAQPEFVIVLSPALIINVPLPAMQALATTNPELYQQLGMRLAARLRQMSAQRALLGMPNITQRVCCQLWQLIPGEAQTQAEGEIRNPPTHMEIAIMLNLSRESVTRVFQVLQNRKIVQRDGASRLLITDLQMLKRLVDGLEEL